jgi:hypothetical protein
MRGTTECLARIFSLFAACSAAAMLAADGPATHENAFSGTAPEVRLEAHEGKTHFYFGERIVLDMVFRNVSGGKFELNNALYRDLSEELEITPASGWFGWDGRNGQDEIHTTPLTDKEIRVPVVLNQGVVFHQPGRYQVRVRTGRVRPDHDLTTNSLTIELEEMPAGMEAERVRSLLKQIHALKPDDNCGCDNKREEWMSELADLEGDDALRAKIELLRQGEEIDGFLLQEAMASTRNLPLQRAQLEALWQDPRQMPSFDILSALEVTRQFQRGVTLASAGWGGGDTVLSGDEKMRLDAEASADWKTLLDSLPQRTGRNRAHAVYLLAQAKMHSAEDQQRLRQLELEHLTEMTSDEQDELLQTQWEKLRSPALLVSLQRILQKDPVRQVALSRLIELDPPGGRPYVVRALCTLKSSPAIVSLNNLPFDTLPEADACFSDLSSTPKTIEQGYARNRRMELAIRFGSPALLPRSRQWWRADPQNPVALALFLRLAPAEAVAGAKTLPAGQVAFSEINRIFKDCKRPLPAEFSNWMRQFVASGTDRQAAQAVLLLMQSTTPQDRALFKARLQSTRAAWADYRAEVEHYVMEKTGQDESLFTPAHNAQFLEIQLVNALLNSGSTDKGDSAALPLSGDELTALAQGCMSDFCNRQFQAHP